jgi:hypothetical protein
MSRISAWFRITSDLTIQTGGSLKTTVLLQISITTARMIMGSPRIVSEWTQWPQVLLLKATVSRTTKGFTFPVSSRRSQIFYLVPTHLIEPDPNRAMIPLTHLITTIELPPNPIRYILIKPIKVVSAFHPHAHLGDILKSTCRVSAKISGPKHQPTAWIDLTNATSADRALVGITISRGMRGFIWISSVSQAGYQHCARLWTHAENL